MSVDFRFHYSQVDDRLAVAADDRGGGTVVLWLTRHLTRQFLEALGKLLEKSGVTASHAPGDVGQILAFEHERAMTQGTGKGKFETVPGNLPLEKTPKLVREIGLSLQPGGNLTINLRAEDASLALELSRDTLHLVYGQVSGLAQHAGWNLDLDAPWEDSAQPPQRQPPKVH